MRVVETILNYFNKNSKTILIVFSVILFVLVGMYFYNMYISPKLKNNFTDFSDVANQNNTGEVGTVDMYFFFADWCPHCVKAKPDWESFMTEKDGTIVNDKTIKCHSVDCTNNGTDDPNVLELMQQHNVSSFPTLIVQMPDSSSITFDAKITKSSLDNFVNTVLK